MADECFEPLAQAPAVRIERIVSTGQATPEGQWYDQPRAEWVALLQGEAGILFEGELEPRRLVPGDWLMIPAHARHRVEWTASDATTVWLAVYYPAPASASP